MYSRWRIEGSRFHLGRMTFGELCRAYASHPAVHLYVALALAAGLYAGLHGEGRWRLLLLPVSATVLAYPVAWYLIHRFVLHSRWLYRTPMTAALWKRAHFDHHQDPQRMDVLFGSPLNTVPTIAAILLPLGWLLGRGAGAAVALCTGFLITCIYEFVHCVQHLNFKPRNRLLRRMKELHLIHHYHDETGNFGITSFAVDRILGTYFPGARSRPRSPHAFNLGYDLEEAQRFPWVAELSGHMPRERPQRARETDDL